MSILGDKPKVLDGFVPGCNTTAAPPLSARCRVRRGLPKLPCVGDRCRTRLLWHRPRCSAPTRDCHGPCAPLRPNALTSASATKTTAPGFAFACMAALGRPCRRIPHARSFGITTLKLGKPNNLKNVASPSDTSGCLPSLTPTADHTKARVRRTEDRPVAICKNSLRPTNHSSFRKRARRKTILSKSPFRYQ